MAKRKKASSSRSVGDYRHEDARRKNNPPAGMAPTYEARERKTTTYQYDPHLDPQLVWSGKAEHLSFDVDVVSLHIHERISTQVVLRAVRRPEPIQLNLFAESSLSADKEVEFYKHDVDWANRLILGDSLLVMNSLLVKEGMAGKVQMIYMDPPYGIKYASNFQPRIDRRDVKDRDEDLTHEPEQIKAYRDTWKLGIHSYLTYLRDRLLLSRELLSDSGSIFVQINDENLHLVRSLLDEVFGRENFISIITFRKMGGLIKRFLPSPCDYILWYAKNKEQTKSNTLYLKKIDTGTIIQYNKIQLKDGNYRSINSNENNLHSSLLKDARIFQTTSLGAVNPPFPFDFNGETFTQNWNTNKEGLERLANAERLIKSGKKLRYIRYLDDFPLITLTDLWEDTMGEREMFYAVQTNTKVIERCILMTTDPGDLVLDPTCGSGTTAWCAEKWGRRWITCDTSRVALAIARQRLMTAKFDYFELKDPERGPAGGFIYQTVPHITLKSIAQNTEIDEIAARYNPQIEQALNDLNKALNTKWKEWEVPRPIPHPTWSEAAKAAYREYLTASQKALTTPEEVQKRKGFLKILNQETGLNWNEKDVPEPVPANDWSDAAREAFFRFWELKQKKRQEIDESIQRNAPQEVLYDKPNIKRGVVRISGPYTVEAIPVPAVEDPLESPIPQFEEQEARARVSDRGGDYLNDMMNLLRQQGGILFPRGKKMVLQNIRNLNLGFLHAEAETPQNGSTQRVAISFGPQHGPVTAFQVQEAIPTAKMNGYPVLIFAGFSFDPEAQALVQKLPVAGLQIHFANIAPDVLVGDLLKTNRASQIFTVFGQPDVKIERQKDGTFTVHLLGVDIYDPISGEVNSTHGEDVAAWFLDTDYDGKTFHICQAFFPGGQDPWQKLQRALKVQIPPEAFEKMRSTTSFPFKPGEHQRIAVKVIDFRGNEVVRVVKVKTKEKN